MTTRIVRPLSHDTDLESKKSKKFVLSSALLGDDLAKNANEAIIEARTVTQDNWVNSEPLLMAHVSEEDNHAYLFPISESLHNKLLLIDIWDYSLQNSIRSLKYLREYHNRYEASGLVVIGVHCPFFTFGKDKKSLFEAMRKLNIDYPVVMDNEYAIWKSLENKTWPRRVLINTRGDTVYDIDEEGQYEELETKIQSQLRILSPGLACPPLLKPIYKPDTSGSEFFFGSKLAARFGNAPADIIQADEQLYSVKMPEGASLYTPWLEGRWVMREESIHPTCQMGSTYTGPFTITMKIQCRNVYIVAATKPKNPGEVSKPVKMQVTINRRPVLDDFFGADLSYSESRKTQLNLREPKLLHVLNNLDGGPHELSFHFDNEGYDTCEVFAIYFDHEYKA